MLLKSITKGARATFCPEARQFNAKLVQGKQIRLEFDEERNDHHGRLLAYVYLETATW